MRTAMSVIALLSLLAWTPAFASTTISGTLSGNNTWTKVESPYVVNGTLILPADSFLTIEPGTVIKMDGVFFVFIEGTLSALGTAADPITITSTKDDTAGGDTNGDEGASTPASGDWLTLYFLDGAHGTFAYTDIRYGGRANGWQSSGQIKNQGGDISISHGEFSDSSGYHIEQSSGTTIVTDSTLSRAVTEGIHLSGGSLTGTRNIFTDNDRPIFASGGTLELDANTLGASRLPSSIDAGVHFVNHGGNTGTRGFAISGTLGGSATWVKDGLPYIISNNLTIPADASLTLAPGIIVKMHGLFLVYINGTLNAEGTADDPITITSMKNDFWGGDTNEDGAASAPAAGDWLSFSISDTGQVTLTHTNMHYGGHSDRPGLLYGQIDNYGGMLSIDHSSISDSGNQNIRQPGGTTTISYSTIARAADSGIVVFAGAFTIHNSIIRDNVKYGAYKANPDSLVDATHNYWGSPTGPFASWNPEGTGNAVTPGVEYLPFLVSEPVEKSADPCAGVENCNSNVLFLPGIMGSRLYWTDPSCILINCENKLWIPNRNDDVENLYMATGTSLLSNVYTKEDGILLEGGPFGTNFYKVFADDMNSMVASGTIEAWKPIAYDWRYDYDHLLSGGLPLDGKIYYDVPTSFPYILEELYTLAASSRTGKITIVAHSNGGLLAKTLIQKLKDDGHAELVDNLILIASPQLGTPQAIGAILHGYDASFLKYYVGKSAQRKLAHDMPMTYNLLPSEKYLSTVSTPVITFDEDVPAHALWGDKINNTGEYLAYLFGADNRPSPDYGELEDPAIANETLFTSALEWHANFDDWTAPTTTTVYQIAGWGVETVSGVHYSNDAWLSDFSWDYEPIMTEDGDGTVVSPSALGNDGQKYWLNLDAYGDDNLDADHGKIFEVPQLRALIVNIIRKEDITDPGQYISTARPSAIDIEKRLRYFLHSPLTLELYDSAGRHVGVSTTTGLIEEQIPGASYNEFGEVKYISIPASASTTLVMRGEDEGRFTLNIQEVTGGVVTATTTFANIPVSTNTLVTMSVPENTALSSLPGLSIDQDGNGTTDIQVLPGTILFPDVTPPEERIFFSTSTHKLLFFGLDTSSTSVVTTATSTTVTDTSGNTFRIPLLSYKEKNRRILLSFNTLVYNGSTTTIATTTLKYKWNINKKGEFTMFAALIKTGSTTVEAHYRPKKNQTIIMTKPTDFDDSDADDACDVRPIKQRLQGMVVPRIQTSNGNINVTY